jgi:hypothetical protein
MGLNLKRFCCKIFLMVRFKLEPNTKPPQIQPPYI